MIRPPPRSTLFPSTTLFRSSVSLPLVRGVTPQALAVFDFAEQGMVAGSRETTTVAPQALYLLNDPFVRRRALALAERALGEAAGDDAAAVDRVYRLTLGRGATPEEIERALGFVAEYRVAYASIPAEVLF